MSARICAFKNCYTSKKLRPNLHMFTFPAKDVKRCKLWIENTGCPKTLAHLTEKQIYTRVVCALHFEQSSFNNYLCNSLNRNAVPVPGFVNPKLLPMLDNDKTQAQVDQLLIQRDPQIRGRCSITSNDKFVSCDTEPTAPECLGSAANKELDPLDTVDNVTPEVGDRDGADGRDEAKCGVTAEQGDIATTTELLEALGRRLSGPPLTLFKMQILRSGDNDNKRKWAVEEKELALVMYYKSAPLYRYMRDRQRFALPSDADIEHWIDRTERSSF